ncbi:MAG: class I SAM-dependent methyltransferase [Eubacterium sp.]|nr:class I SAM-dependent methyltransferase [Eubacterium sp.]
MENKTIEKWPKKLPKLTKRQQAIKDDFFHQWLDTLPKKFGAVEIFNQNYPAKIFIKDQKRKKLWRTLEIGGGIGSHIPFENMGSQSYTILELRENLVQTLKEKYPHVNAIVGDCQETYAKKGSFDRIIAIHVLEHLPNLPEAVKQMHRVLTRGGGSTYCDTM